MKKLLFSLLILNLTLNHFSIYSIENTFEKDLTNDQTIFSSASDTDLPTDFSEEKIYEISSNSRWLFTTENTERK
jgi:hypothetical protein